MEGTFKELKYLTLGTPACTYKNTRIPDRLASKIKSYLFTFSLLTRYSNQRSGRTERERRYDPFRRKRTNSYCRPTWCSQGARFVAIFRKPFLLSSTSQFFNSRSLSCTMFTRFAERRRREEPRDKKATLDVPQKFDSVLSQPFGQWNDIENVVGEFVPEWTHTQRSLVIQNLIGFLELKVIMEDHAPNQLLAPTKLVARAWQALILETMLYKKVAIAIQDFHGRPHRMIPHSFMEDVGPGAYEVRLKRTQHLFQTYHGDTMPSFLEEIDNDFSLSGASALTEAVGILNCASASCTAHETGRRTSRDVIEGPMPVTIEKDSSLNNFSSTWFSPERWLCVDLVKEVFCDDDYSVDGTMPLDEDEKSIVTPARNTPSGEDEDVKSIATLDRNPVSTERDDSPQKANTQIGFSTFERSDSALVDR